MQNVHNMINALPEYNANQLELDDNFSLYNIIQLVGGLQLMMITVWTIDITKTFKYIPDYLFLYHNYYGMYLTVNATLYSFLVRYKVCRYQKIC